VPKSSTLNVRPSACIAAARAASASGVPLAGLHRMSSPFLAPPGKMPGVALAQPQASREAVRFKLARHWPINR
jgi:hypothetical protein